MEIKNVFRFQTHNGEVRLFFTQNRKERETEELQGLSAQTQWGQGSGESLLVILGSVTIRRFSKDFEWNDPSLPACDFCFAGNFKNNTF